MMKPIRLSVIALGLALAPVHGAEPANEAKPDDAAAKQPADTAEMVEKHREGSTEVAGKQDELSADLQQLTNEQTIPKVIELFKEVEDIMGDAIDWLTEHDTGGRTIAAQTEVVEKIYEAAKERQKQGGGQAGGAMMDMMEQMMKDGEGKEPGKKPGDKPGNQGGQGMTGDSKDPNEANGGNSDAKSGERRVPKAAGTGGAPLPEEFRKALDAYNRGMEKKVK